MKIERVVESYSYNRFGEILYILQRNNRKYLNDMLAKHDLNLLQAMCLLILEESNEISQKDLAQFLYLTKSGITKSINKLESDGFIKKERSKKDSRKFVLNLTHKGEKILPVLKKINDDWEEKVGLNDLSDEFLDTLKKLAYNSIELNTEED